jgi:S1-C subfamily serine protease
MNRGYYKHLGLILAALMLMVGALGCGLISMSTYTSDGVSAEAVPTPIPALPDEVAAVSALESQIIGVYEAVSPAVVNVTNRGYALGMFGRRVLQEGTGSGFIYDGNGAIVTNYHVVEGAEELLVTLADGRVYEAEIVGTDAANDLAVVRIQVEGELPAPLVLADSNGLRVGQFVVAIGNPYGLQQTLTTGVVSALGRVIESPEDDRFIGEVIQTDAAINPGNSGGPLLDLQGRVVGVNSQIISPSGGSAGIGFAVASSTMQRVVPQLISQGRYSHPWLGLRFLTLTPSAAEMLREAGMDVAVEGGLLVLEAEEASPAAAAGIRDGDRVARIGMYQIPLGGDIVTAVNDQPIHSLQDLTVYLETYTKVGDSVELSVVRNGELLGISVTLEEKPQV